MTEYHTIGCISGITVICGSKDLEIRLDPVVPYVFDEKEGSQTIRKTILISDKGPSGGSVDPTEKSDVNSSATKPVTDSNTDLALIRPSSDGFKLSSCCLSTRRYLNDLLKVKAEKMKVKITCDDKFTITTLEIL